MKERTTFDFLPKRFEFNHTETAFLYYNDMEVAMANLPQNNDNRETNIPKVEVHFVCGINKEN